MNTIKHMQDVDAETWNLRRGARVVAVRGVRANSEDVVAPGTEGVVVELARARIFRHLDWGPLVLWENGKFSHVYPGDVDLHLDPSRLARARHAAQHLMRVVMQQSVREHADAIWGPGEVKKAVNALCEALGTTYP